MARSTFGPRYPKRTDKYGMKFQKGFRTAWKVEGPRPLVRSTKRPLRAR